MIDNNQYADAKLSIVPTKPTVISNIINLYGSESDYFVKHLRPYLKSKATTICNLDTCPKPVQLLESSTIILGKPSGRNAEKQEGNIVAHALADWASAGVSHCKRKFVGKPDVSLKYTEDARRCNFEF